MSEAGDEVQDPAEPRLRREPAVTARPGDAELEAARREEVRERIAGLVLARLLDPVTVNGTPRWDIASPYLLRHAAEHAAEAGELSRFLQDWEFLVHADPHSVLTFGSLLEAETRSLALPGEPNRVRSLPVYRASVVEHASAGFEERRHILAVDAARHQWPEFSRQLYHPAHADPVPWQCRWSTASNISSHLRGALPHDSALSSVVTGTVPGLSYAVTTAQDDRVARVWDLSDSSLLQTVHGHLAPLTAVRTGHGPTGPLVVTADEIGALRCWEPEGGETRWGVTAHEGRIDGLVLSRTPDGGAVVTHGHDGTVGVWDLETGALRHRFTDLARRGDMVVTGEQAGHDTVIVLIGEGRMHCLDIGTGAERFRRGLGAGEAVGLAAAQVSAGPAVVVTYDEGHAQVWRLDTGRVHTTLTGGTPASMTSVAVTDNGLECVAVTGGGDGVIRVWDIEGGGPPLHELTAHFAEITALTCYVTEQRGRPRTFQHEDPTEAEEFTSPSPSRQRMRRVSGQTRRARLRRSLSGRFLLSASADHTMHEWDLAGASPRQTFTAHTAAPRMIRVTEVAGRPVAVSCGQDGTAHVWTLDDRRSRSVGGVTHPLPVRSVAVDRVDGRMLVATGCGDERLRVLAGADGRSQGMHANGRGQVTAVGLGASREGPVVVVATTDGRLTARRPETGERLWQVTSLPASVSALLVGGSRRRPLVLTLGPDGLLRVHSLATGRPQPGDLADLTGVTAVAAARVRGRPVVVTAQADGLLRLWNVPGMALRRSVEVPAGPIDALALADAAGGPLIAGCVAGRLHVWDADTGRLKYGTPMGPTSAMALGEFRGRPMVVTAPAARKEVCFRDAETGEAHATVSLPAPVNALSLTDGVLVVGYGREVAAFSAYDNPGPWDVERQTEPPPVLAVPELPAERGRKGRGRLSHWDLPVLAYLCRQDTPQTLADLRVAFRGNRHRYGRQALKNAVRSLASEGLIQQSDERGRYVPTSMGRYRIQRAREAGRVIR